MEIINPNYLSFLKYNQGLGPAIIGILSGIFHKDYIPKIRDVKKLSRNRTPSKNLR
jgi:hypothetical protein